jgi:hypothetical protein
MTSPEPGKSDAMRLFDTAAVGMCQLVHIDEMGRKNSWLNDKLQYSIRKVRYFRRTIRQRLQVKKIGGNSPPDNPEPIRPGDLVRVCSEAEIRQTLDRSRKTKGCTFQLEMYKHCGKEFKVYKKVRYFFDETKQKMCRCHDTYLLEGSFCSGKTAYLKPCGRNCFFFWQRSWLKKV